MAEYFEKKYKKSNKLLLGSTNNNDYCTEPSGVAPVIHEVESVEKAA
jgi:hypothetical protein